MNTIKHLRLLNALSKLHLDERPSVTIPVVDLQVFVFCEGKKAMNKELAAVTCGGT